MNKNHWFRTNRGCVRFGLVCGLAFCVGLLSTRHAAAQAPASQFLNISTRASVGTGAGVAVGGFIIGGTGTKQVLLRGFGPTLTSFGITGALGNPTLDLYWDDDNNPSTPAILVLNNDDWGTALGSCPAPVVVCGSPMDIENTGLSANSYAPTSASRALDAALLLTLPPGTYTARLSGAGNGTGVGLIGMDDVDSNQTARLANISTRAFVGTGADVAVGGFIITGTNNKQLLIRGFGPTLTSFGIAGALSNPTLDLYWDNDNNPSTPAILVLTNNDWGAALPSCPTPAVACGTPQQIINTGLSANTYAPTNGDRALDAALLITLPPGTYTARLSGVNAVTGVGLIGVDEIETTTPIGNQSPQANAGGPYTALTWDLVTFNGLGSIDPDNDPLTYTWDFGDGTTGSGATPTHYYPEAGTYTVSVTVTDPYNTSHTASTTATVTPLAPVNYAPIANAGGPYAGVVGEVLTFSAVGSTDPNGDPLTYTWNFGDGFTGVGLSVSHTYAAAGTYSVTATATDSGSVSNSATTTATISVFNPSNSAPTASVTVPSQGLVLQNLILVGSGADPDNDSMTYSWNFGDGHITAFGPNPSAVHEYAQAGTYVATLTANDGQGHSVSASGSVTITLPATPVAFAQSLQIGRRSGNVGDYMHRRAIELDGAGVPPLQFNIVDYPDNWASDAQSLNIGYGAYYQWWNPIANQWRPECHSTISVPASCAAPFWSHVHPGTGAITMTAPATPPTVGYLPERCWIWPELTDSFSFTVTDGNGVTSAPAVVAMTLSATTCHWPSF